MAPRIAQVLNATALRQILRPDTPVEDIVDKLYEKGHELYMSLERKTYKDMSHWRRQHQEMKTELAALEGPSEIHENDVMVLKTCPIADEMAKLNVNGQPPAFHSEIIADYMEQNPGSNAILHPGCIAHQAARQMVVANMDVGGERNMNFHQISCRSATTGETVFDDNGLRTAGMKRKEAERMVNGNACVYSMSMTAQGHGTGWGRKTTKATMTRTRKMEVVCP